MRVTGPWLGVDERTHLHQPAHSRLSINVDYSNGYIEAREGFKTLNQSIAADNGQLFIFNSLLDEPYIFILGYTSATDKINCQILDLNGIPVGTIDMTTLFGERAYRDWTCSVTRIPYKEGGSAVLIVTEKSTYIWTVSDAANIRVIDQSEDSVQIFDTWFYWTTPPACKMAHWHRGRMYYAGFSPDTSFGLTDPAPVDISASHPVLLMADRQHLKLSSCVISFSDTYDPVAIRSGHQYTVAYDERVTGLASYKDSMLVFTDKNIWITRGDPGSVTTSTPNYPVDKLVNGIGCVSHQSITVTRAGVFFAGVDGIYLLQEKSVIKVSRPIDGLFGGTTISERRPQGSLTTRLLDNVKYPWKANMERLTRIRSFDVPHKNQVWFAIPTLDTYDIAIVFQYDTGAWSYYAFSQDRSFMSDGDYVVRNGKPLLYTTGSNVLMVSRGDIDYHNSGAYTRAPASPGALSKPIPFYWESARFTSEDEHHLRHFRFNMFKRGNPTSKPEWFVEGLETKDGRRSYGYLDLHYTTDDPGVWGDDWYVADNADQNLIFDEIALFENRVSPGSVSGKQFSIGITDYLESSVTPCNIKISDFSLDFVKKSRR